MIESLLILWHFAQTRWLTREKNRARLLANQQKKLRRFLQRVVRDSPFYQSRTPELKEFPVMTKAMFLEHFTELNRASISLEQATAVGLRAERERDFKPQLPGGISVGFSSGTSGARHVFLVDRADRCRWTGQILARLLSSASLRRVFNPLSPPLRIAYFLRASSNLYQTISSRRIKLAYADLTRPFDELWAELVRLSPEILVAPATVLADLARREKLSKSGLRPTQIISVAEVLDGRDQALIESVFGVPVAQIYQAAEGFLGYTCEEGRLHLNEEKLHIETQWMDEKHDRFQPVITDFTRSTQWFVRCQLNDILRVDEAPCPCGRASMRLQNIEGRSEEVLWAKDKQGVNQAVFPDSLRQALYSMPEPLDLYRIEQHGERWEIRLRLGHESLEQSVRFALNQLLDGLGLGSPEWVFLPWTDQALDEKQKRIRCICPPL